MAIIKIASFLILSSSVFAVSTVSTIGINKAIAGKETIPDEPSNQQSEKLEDSEDLFIEEETHQSLFATNLTTFGNMSANLSVNILHGDNEYTIYGNAFVSLEELSNPEIYADLSIDMFNRHFDLEATYKEGTIYVNLNNNKLYLNTSDITKITDLFAQYELNLPVPESFKNIDAMSLLNRLSMMTAEEKGEQIVYTCSLFDDFPPFIFTSDLDHNLTGLTINHLQLMGLDISVKATANVLGAGHNEVKVPSDAASYQDATTLLGMSKTVEKFLDINNISLGVDYDIRVTRDGALTFTTSGDIDLKKVNDDITASLVGNMVNNEGKEKLNSNFAIAYQNDTIYFNYNDSLKLSYDKASIAALVDIIKTRLPNDLGMSGMLDTLLPDGSTASCPLFTLIASNNYFTLLDYYKKLEIKEGLIELTLDASLFGNTTGDLILSINHGDLGLEKITISNLYAFGYRLDMELSLRDYQEYHVNDEGYTTLNYVNNLFDGILDMIQEEKYALNLSGSVTSDSLYMSFNGSTQFSLGETQDKGIGKIAITDKNNTVHNVTIDVTREKVDRDASEEEKYAALKSSDVLFSYNDNLKGSFNLGSLSDTIDLITSLAGNSKRIQKYVDLLTADYSHSIINEILNGHIEAILYQNLLNSFTRVGNDYIIEIDGNFIKKNTDIDVSNLKLILRSDANNNFKGITIQGNIIGIDIDITLTLATYSSTYKGLTKDSSYFDFSDMGDLVKYLLNTAGKNDFTLDASITLSILGDMNMKGYVHITEEYDGTEKVYAKAIIDNIPSILIVSEETWKNRTFTMYFTDDEVFLDVVIDKYIGSDKHKETHMSIQEFLNNALDYILGYGMGIDQSIYKDALEKESTSMDLSKLLTGYKYNSATPSWDLTLNMAELADVSSTIMGPLSLTISGNKTTGLLERATGSMSLLGILSVSFNGRVTSYDYIGDSMFNSILSYINGHRG